MSIAEDTRIAPSSSEPSNEFDYTPMSPMAPIAFLLGVIGLTAFLGFYGIIVAFIAAVVSLLAVRRIGRAEGTLGGRRLAMAGLAMSTVSVLGGSTMFSIAYATECPEGYDRVNFPREIAARMFVLDEFGRRAIHPEVVPLLKRPIFLKGYVYQTRATRGRRDFILLKDSGKCCFGGDPAPFDMIQIRLSEDHESVDFRTLSMVSIAGILTADPNAPAGAAVYTMEAHRCELARTSF